MDRVYRHYGSSVFDISKFISITNRPGITFINKPYGGLWASPVDSDNNWYKWCLSENFNIKSLDEYFDFTLKNNSKILSINKISDLNKITDHIEILPDFCIEVRVDFESLVEASYDVVYAEYNYETAQIFYGWDVDTLLVLNPDCISLKESVCMMH